jgi:Spy/CpxP family protein refolding chaperone
MQLTRVAVTLFFSLLASGIAFAADPTPTCDHPSSPPVRGTNLLSRGSARHLPKVDATQGREMFADLGLNTNQLAQAKAELAVFLGKARTSVTNLALPPAERKAATRAAYAEFQGKLKDILTPEQFAVFSQRQRPPQISQ